jgi:hypothetical protein
MLLFILLIFSGCAKDNIYNSDFDPNKNFLTQISLPVMIISDNQEHSQFGTAQFKNSELVDHLITDVTRRPVQQNLFSKYILELAISHKDLPIIHLGDFLDISCRSEFDRFISIFNDHGQPWALTIGNHDGYFLGNYMSTNLIDDWAGLCDNGRYYDNQNHRLSYSINDRFQRSVILTKSDVISEYLFILSTNQINNLHSVLFDNSGQLNKKGSWFSRDINSFFKRINWSMGSCTISPSIDICEPYRSFIIQEIRLPAAKGYKSQLSMLIVDTAQYDMPFNIRTSIVQGKQAGTLGSIQNDQALVLKKWISENAENKIPTFIAGHHPYKDLDKKTKNLFAKFARILNGSIFYISGHTHKGGWYQYEIGDGNYLYELNIGSINDWPIQYRTLEFFEGKKETTIVKSIYYPISYNDLQNIGFNKCENSWFIDSSSPISAESQEKGATGRYYKAMRKNILANLYAYSDLLNKFPDGDVTKVKYAIPVNEELSPYKIKEFQSYEQLKSYVEESAKMLEKYIAENDTEKSTREFARLADTINLYKADYRFEEEMRRYKSCQSIQVSTEDAKSSKTGFFESIFGGNINDANKSRYDIYKISETNRKKEYAEIK